MGRVLGLEGLGTEDNFFDLGGNSLKANALVQEVIRGPGLPFRLKTYLTVSPPASWPGILPSPWQTGKSKSAGKTRPYWSKRI